MTKAPSKTQTTAVRETFGILPSLFPIDRLLNGNGQSLEAWTEMNRTLTERFSAWQAGAARFLSKRLDEEITSQRELAACRTPSEAVEVCTAFTRTAVRDYLEEAGKAADLAGEMTRACAMFGESLAGSAARATATDGGTAPMTAVAKASEEARTGIAA